MIQIDVNEVLALKARLNEINKLELDEVLLVKDGVIISVSDEAKELWRFSGLLLSDYILMMNKDNQVEIITKNSPKKL
jgi:hypothetical protein